MQHTDSHPTLVQWDRLICLHPGCGDVSPREYTDAEIEIVSPEDPTVPLPTVEEGKKTAQPVRRRRGK